MRLSPARAIAYDTYVDVMNNKKRPEEVLATIYGDKERSKNLKRVDRNFIKELVYGSLRWHSKILWILQNTSKRDLKTTTPEIRAALVVGTYQIFYMDRVPDRAAVNESVEYVRSKNQANATSFVNGILRQIARKAAYFPKPDKEKRPGEYLALQFAHPGWITDRWLKHFRFERMEKILSANNHQPPFSVRFNTMKTPTEKVAELQDELLRSEGTHTNRRSLRSALRFKESPRFEDGSMFSQGYYTMQDEAAQLIGLLVNPQKGDTIVDACAGPGGKLSHLYELTEGDANFIAVERSKTQYTKAQDTMKRLGHIDNVEWVQGDFLKWEAKEKVDKILLDSPCTGLGVLRRHPEGKWQKTAEIIPSLAQKQRELIKHALSQLKVGGQLTFAVCSFEPEETVDHLSWLRKEFGEHLELITPVSRLPDYFKKYVTRDNLLLIYAGNQDEMDGFGAFTVKLTKEL